MKTELVCKCGARLEVSVKKHGGVLSMMAVALANHWYFDPEKLIDGAKCNAETPATCPNCRVPATAHCQCRDC